MPEIWTPDDIEARRPRSPSDPQVKSLMDKARTAYTAGENLRKKAQTENRDLTPEEMETVTKSFGDAMDFKAQADTLVTGNRLRSFFEDARPNHPAGPAEGATHLDDADPVSKGAARRDFERMIAERKAAGWSPGLVRLQTRADLIPWEARNRAVKAFFAAGGNVSAMKPEDQKVLTSLADPDGGYAVTSESSNEVIQRIRDEAEIINMCTRRFTDARSISFPNLDFTATVDAVAERGTVPEQDWADLLGKTQFTPTAKAKIFRMPQDWLDDAALDMEGLLVDMMSIVFAETMEQDIVSGAGKNGPQGLYTAPFNTTETTNASLVLTPEDFKGLPFDIKKQYRRRASWILTRAVCKQVALLRDASGGAGTGQFMWQMALRAGEPNTLAGYSVLESEYAPAFANTAGSPAALFGDFRWYWLVIRRALTIKRLVELFAQTREIGILMDLRYDGAPVLKDPFRKLVRKA